MFQAMSSPIISSTWLYLQLLVLSTVMTDFTIIGIVATVLVTVKSVITVDNIRSSKYSQVLLMMGEDIVRNM